MKTALILAAAIAAYVPTAAEAQLGAVLAARTVSGRDDDPSIGQRNGFEFRLLWDGGRAERALGWRLELAGAQVKYQADEGTQRVQISENSVELATLLRAELRGGALAGVYFLAGPVASVRLTCGLLGGYVDCADDRSRAIGVAGGVGYEVLISPRRALLFELRLANGVVGAAGHPTVSLGIGLRVEQLLRDR